MPFPVYSTRFFRIAGGAGGPTVAFACPLGKVAVVKCMGITIGSTVAEASAWIEADDGSKLMWAHASDTPATAPFTLVEFGEWVLIGTETLAYATSAPTIADFWCSGYLFDA